MNERTKALHAKWQGLINRGKELSAKATLTEEENTEAAGLPAAIAAAQKDFTDAQALEKALTAAEAFDTAMVPVATVAGVDPARLQTLAPQIVPAGTAVLSAQNARLLARGRARHFKAATQEQANEKALRFGMFVIAALSGNAQAKAFCASNGIPIQREIRAAGQVESINEDGGFLVPVEFENDLIDLREQYGIFRQFAKNKQMSRETLLVPRRTGGLTAYFKGEADAAMSSKKGWDLVELTARKVMCFAYISSELNEDAVIGVGDDLANEIAYAFAKLEDDCGFNGDGTSTYGKILGVRQKLKDVDATIANIKGLQVAAGNNYSEITLADFNGVLGRLPQYADTPNTAWYVHKTFYHTVMEKLMLAAGGVTAAEIAAGRRVLQFMGYPVHITQQMPSAEGNSQVCALFGDLALAAMFGDRRSTTIAMSSDFAFDTDELAIRGTERFDINVHDVGNTSVAGPIVGLITAAA